MSISTGNAWVEFTLWENDGPTVYTLPYASITQFDSKPIYAEDGYTLLRYEQSMSGSALISSNDSTYTLLRNYAKKVPGIVERVRVRVQNDTNTEDILDVSRPDSLNGPLMSFTITEITGRNAAIASFGITANTVVSAESDPSCILAHRWVQSFNLDEAGYMTRTVTGTLTVDIASSKVNQIPATGRSDISDKAPLADLFRKAILPLGFGDAIWRRQSQSFAYNEAGNQLIYTIVDKQATKKLPNGAYSGTADFTYERTMANIAYATLRFNCELEGYATADVRNLIWAAVVIAKSRIDFVASRFDRVSVQEMDLLDKKRIRLEITALAPATASDAASGTYAAVPLANVIGKYFSVVRTQAWAPDAYGGYVGVAGAPHWRYNRDDAKTSRPSIMPVAFLINAMTDYSAPGTPTIIMEGGDSSLSQANAELNNGPFRGMVQSSFNAQVQPTTVERSQTVTNVMIDTRMERLPTLYTQGADFVFQAGKPEVIIEEITTTKKVNEPPTRTVRPMPAGFIMLSQDWKVNLGEIDSSGNRTFIGVYTRRMKAIDGGGEESNGFKTDGKNRIWWSPSKTVTAPLALGFDTSSDFQDSTKTVLETTANQSYDVGDPEAYA